MTIARRTTPMVSATCTVGDVRRRTPLPDFNSLQDCSASGCYKGAVRGSTVSPDGQGKFCVFDCGRTAFNKA